jgi:phosphate starvation-inducible PhoH-like protein
LSKGAPKAGSDFVALPDAALRAVAGPNNRHAALIEDAFSVLIETPGGGISIGGHGRDRARAREVAEALAARVAAGEQVGDPEVRVAINTALSGEISPAPRGPVQPRRTGAVGPKTPAQARYQDLLARYELVFGVGPAGTGKTFLAVAHGASLLLRGEVDRLVITRPAVEAGERLGFLPGDMNEKVDPYMAPVFEALNDIIGPDQFRRRRDKGEIEVAPIAFMRGRTLNHAFVIVDEAQNATKLQLKMVLTRLGAGARMVVTGDPSQVDLVNPRDSGLAHALRILDGVDGVAVAKFEAKDVVRHPLVERIVRAYDADQAT